MEMKDAFASAYMGMVQKACELAIELGATPKTQEMNAIVGHLLIKTAIHMGEQMLERNAHELGICKEDPRQAEHAVPGACGCATPNPAVEQRPDEASPGDGVHGPEDRGA